jgi:hypothetical protein
MMDSSYQNFRSSPVDLKAVFIEYCRESDTACQVKPLTTIHRNSRKVVSFIRSNSQKSRKSGTMEISCSHHIDGDDVEIRRVSNLRQDDDTNELVALVRELIDSKALLRGQSGVYPPSEVAILVDTPDSEADAQCFRRILLNQYPESRPQDACLYPIQGIRIDLLDDFMGLDSNVCICLPRMKKGSKKKPSFDNPKYRNYVASRGIFRVIFLTEAEFDADVVQHMQLDDVPYSQPK